MLPSHAQTLGDLLKPSDPAATTTPPETQTTAPPAAGTDQDPAKEEVPAAPIVPIKPATTVFNKGAARQCKEEDLLGNWAMVDQYFIKDADPSQMHIFPFQIYSFASEGRLRNMASDAPIEPTDFHRYQLSPWASNYALDSKGKLKIIVKDTGSPMYYTCTVILKDVTDQTGSVIMDEGNLLLKFLGKKNNIVYEKQLRKFFRNPF